jgi:hypothetical protein
VAGHFGISRQAAARYVRELVDAGRIKATGERKEHVVWETRIADKLKGLPQNVLAMWNYGCSEMIVTQRTEPD